jgi:hypothetical protein
MTEIADHGYSYPTSRFDSHEWHAELHRAAEALDWWVRPPRHFDTDNDRERNLRDAKQGWRWIVENLSDLWD